VSTQLKDRVGDGKEKVGKKRRIHREHLRYWRVGGVTRDCTVREVGGKGKEKVFKK
jgi:hypothetical protein